jgi:hypothetical protein
MHIHDSPSTTSFSFPGMTDEGLLVIKRVLVRRARHAARKTKQHGRAAGCPSNNGASRRRTHLPNQPPACPFKTYFSSKKQKAELNGEMEHLSCDRYNASFYIYIYIL